MENSNSSSVDDPGSIFLESVTNSVTLCKEDEADAAVLTPTIIQNIVTDKEELVSVPFEVITLPDGTQTIFTPECLLADKDLLIKGEEEIDVSNMTVIQEPEHVIDTNPIIMEANVIQLENGTYAFVHNQPQDGCYVVKMEDGSVAYITLTRGVLEEDEEEVTNTVETVEVEEQTLQVDEKKSRPGYRCDYSDCGRRYTTIHHLKVHERSHTGVRPYLCMEPGCNKAFATDYGRKAHIRTHTGEKPYHCKEPDCSKSFKTSGDLQKHTRTHTGERPFACPVEGCDRSFTTSNIRKVHIRTHTGEKPYVCTHPGCERSFASATNFKNHMRIHSGEKPFVCEWPGCEKRFTEYSSLYKHHLVHTKEKPYHCLLCGHNYRQISTLVVHKRTAHGVIEADDGTEIVLGNMFGVSGSKKFKNLTNNVVHERTQAATRLYVCTEQGCNRAFANEYEKEIHSKTHTVENSYTCKEHGCEESFKTFSDLAKHSRRHTDDCHVLTTLEDGSTAYISLSREELEGDEEMEHIGQIEEQTLQVDEPQSRPNSRCSFDGGQVYTVNKGTDVSARSYACTVSGCKKVFGSKNARKAHAETHSLPEAYQKSIQRPYQCTDCMKRFKTPGDLHKHTLTHTGEKPYPCLVEGCDKSFATSNMCKIHIRTHTNITGETYRCTYPGCSRSFSTLVNFKNHMQTHSGEKQFVCGWPNCEKMFTEYSSLCKHNSAHSKGKPFQCNLCGQNYNRLSTLLVHKRTAHAVTEADDGMEIVLGDMVGVTGSKKLDTFASHLLTNINRDDGRTVVTLQSTDQFDEGVDDQNEIYVLTGNNLEQTLRY